MFYGLNMKTIGMTGFVRDEFVCNPTSPPCGGYGCFLSFRRNDITDREHFFRITIHTKKLQDRKKVFGKYLKSCNALHDQKNIPNFLYFMLSILVRISPLKNYVT